MTTGITEYAAGFEYSESERGITATSIYRFDPDSTVDNGVVVPNPGDSLVFPAPFLASITQLDMIPPTGNNIICRSKTIRALAGHPNKFEWVCSFTNEPVDPNVFTFKVGTYGVPDIDKLPMTIEYSGEFTTINPTNTPGSSGWKWNDLGTSVMQPLPFRVNSSTLRIIRYVADSEYQTFQSNVRALSGHVNYVDNPLGTGLAGGIGCWLFVGCTTETFRNDTDDKWWRAELEFIYRNPDGTDLEGWNKVLRLDGKWDIPIMDVPLPSGQDSLYPEGDFDALFDETVVAIP